MARGSVAAERRTKAHFRREDPITVLRLARRRGFRRIESQRPSQPEKTERRKFAEIGLEQDEGSAVLRSGFERIAAALLVVSILVGVMRMV